MSMTVDQLVQEALLLPGQARALLADKLVESLDATEVDDVQRLWSKEAIRRRDEIRSGRVKAIPGEDVINEARRLVRRT